MFIKQFVDEGLGNSAYLVASATRQRGYDKLILIDGGFNAWRAAGYEVER